MVSTLQNYGVPLGDGTGRGGIIMPKRKDFFRVTVFNFGPFAGGIEITQQVMRCGLPEISQNEVDVHAYNSLAYYGGKVTFGTINLTLRDDVSNNVSRLVGHQLQKQKNFFAQTVPLAGSNYKFQMQVETLNGGDTGVLETWYMEGCFATQTSYGDLDYSSADGREISLTIRPDNVTQGGGLMPLAPDLLSGILI
jgi:hypothetical protein